MTDNDNIAIKEMAQIICLDRDHRGDCDKCCYYDGRSRLRCSSVKDAEKLYQAGYRKQSEIIDEFAKKLKDYPIEVRLPLLGLETKEEVETYVNKLFDQIESIVDKIAEEMKGD